MQTADKNHWIKSALIRFNTALIGADALIQSIGGIFIAYILGQFTAIIPHLLWWLTISVLSFSYYFLFRWRIKQSDHHWPHRRWIREFLGYRFIVGLLWCWPLSALYSQPDSQILSILVAAVYGFFLLVVALINLINGTMAATGFAVLAGMLALAAVTETAAYFALAVVYTIYALLLIRVSLVIRSAVKAYALLGYKTALANDEIMQKTEEQRKLHKEVAQDKEQLELLAKNSTDVIALHAENGRYLYVNDVVQELLGYRPEEVLGELPVGYIHKDDRSRVIHALKFQEVDANGKRQLGEFRMRHKLGHYIWLEAFERRLQKSQGQRGVHTVTVTRDVTERHKSEISLAAQQQTLEVSLGSIRDIVLTLDANGVVLYSNKATEALVGDSSLVGRPLHAALPMKDESGRQAVHWSSLPLNQQQTVLFEYEPPIYFEMSVHRLHAAVIASQINPALVGELEQASGLQEGYVVVLRNITKRRELEQQLKQRAYTDSLTGVMNRVAFEERLQKVNDSVRRIGGSHALVFVDLDQFKIVNDTAGHHAGDKLLKVIATTLSASVREDDVVARLGGDEFALLLSDCAVGDARRRSQEVCDAVAAIDFSWEDRYYPVGGSFGVAMFDKTTPSVEVLMGRADAACYVVKDLGRNGVHVWTEDDADSGRQFTDMNWVSRLQSALREQRILIYAQQIWDLEEGTGFHLEVLISLRDVDGSLVSPIEFIPAAERYGIMPTIDHYVMEAVFKHIAPLQQELLASGYRIAINLSGHTIGSDVALDQIRKLFHRYDLNPHLICFEITETVALQNMADAQRFLLALKAMGCELALDDFGTGFSSFSYLKSLPVDILKIDGEFVREMLYKDTDHAIVEGIHKVGHTMGLKTVAESVENADILQELRAIGVDYGQGMFLSKRRPLKEIINKQLLALGTPSKLSA